jgi:hypothetical protein
MMLASDVCVKFYCVWVFLVGPPNAQVVWEHETWESRKLCEKWVPKFQRTYNEQVECVRMVVDHPDGQSPDLPSWMTKGGKRK